MLEKPTLNMSIVRYVMRKFEICDEKIYNPLELRQHKVFVQKETKCAWLCVECPKSTFFSKSSFEKHMKAKH
jgi:hypothetical protein